MKRRVIISSENVISASYTAASYQHGKAEREFYARRLKDGNVMFGTRGNGNYGEEFGFNDQQEALEFLETMIDFVKSIKE